MKRIFTVCTAVAILLSLSACGASGNPADTGAANNPESQVSTENQNTMTGTLSEVKDTMFVITQGNGDSYAFSFEGDKPKGLDKVSAGDAVTVTYTGEVSLIDAFNGTVISVEAAK